MSARDASIKKIAGEVAKGLRDGDLVGLGSGSTVASILPHVASSLREAGVEPCWVPTSLQIQMLAQSLKLRTSPLTKPTLVRAVDGADQVDRRLNLIKGGGGALLREKVLLANCKDPIIVADERKFAERLCMNGVRVPVEVSPFAREAVAARLKEEGDVALRLDQRGYPGYSENGNLIMDVLFEPITDPRRMEEEIKGIPGVMEAGVFVIRPITVYKIKAGGGYQALKSAR